MTFFSRCDAPPTMIRGAARVRLGPREERATRRQALADFAEEISILFRYATGRDYYDRQAVVGKDER